LSGKRCFPNYAMTSAYDCESSRYHVYCLVNIASKLLTSCRHYKTPAWNQRRQSQYPTRSTCATLHTNDTITKFQYMFV